MTRDPRLGLEVTSLLVRPKTFSKIQEEANRQWPIELTAERIVQCVSCFQDITKSLGHQKGGVFFFESQLVGIDRW